MRTFVFALAALYLTACPGDSTDDKTDGDAGDTPDTYCSPTKGPLTAVEAAGVEDAKPCPPPGYTTATCSTEHGSLGGTNQAGPVATDGGGGDSSAETDAGEESDAPAGVVTWTCWVQDGEGGAGSGS